MMAEIYGRETGCCGGRGGSMHLFDDDAGVLLTLPIVASSIPIAVGAAFALRQQGSDALAVAFVGDGSVEEGVFHESMNLAAVHSLPVLFILENNLFSVYTNLDARQPKRPLTDLGTAHGVHSGAADGNDVEAVFNMTKAAAARARAGQGPSLLVFDTYRWREHCGPNYDNDIGYRTEAEFQSWKLKCPLTSLQRKLESAGKLSDAAATGMNSELMAEIDAAFDFADASPFPALPTAKDFVYV
jgi:TPP-dependent pyruvate/acetoin dehydrogenase alpha subunit